MADDQDVDDMLEAPITKSVSLSHMFNIEIILHTICTYILISQTI